MKMNRYVKTAQRHKDLREVVVIAIVFFLMAFNFTSCEKKTESEVLTGVGTEVEETSSVNIRIDLNEDTQNEDLLQSAVGTVSDVAVIKVVVKTADESQETISEATLQETFDGSQIWEGVVENVRLGVELQFEANAYNEDGELIFTDTIIQTLETGETDLTSVDIIFEMESVDDGIQPDNPKILSVVIPEEVTVGSNDILISFQITHSSVVEYRLAIEKGSLSAPLEGTHDPTSDLEVRYNAPATPGEDLISIWVNDPDGTDSVGAIFPIQVVDSSVPVVIDVQFGPVITGMDFIRGSEFLMISARTEPETGLSIVWSGNGSFTGLAATGNPVIIEPFTDNYSGEITVSATDDYGLEAELIRTIAVGDFPYLVVNPEPEPEPEPEPDPQIVIPDGTVLDEDTGLLWQDNGERMRLKWSDAIFYCEDGLALGGYTDWRIPTRQELKTAYKHRAIFSSFKRSAYWTSDRYIHDLFRAWSLRFSSGFERIGRKKHKRDVRCVRTWE